MAIKGSSENAIRAGMAELIAAQRAMMMGLTEKYPNVLVVWSDTQTDRGAIEGMFGVPSYPSLGT